MIQDMKITDELLAAYAEGNVSEPERQAVRQYLTDNPSELETVRMMMDEDYDLNINDEADIGDIRMEKCGNTFSDICYSAAAFVPPIKPLKKIFEKHAPPDKKSFNQRLGDLLDEII